MSILNVINRLDCFKYEKQAAKCDEDSLEELCKLLALVNAHVSNLEYKASVDIIINDRSNSRRVWFDKLESHYNSLITNLSGRFNKYEVHVRINWLKGFDNV